MICIIALVTSTASTFVAATLAVAFNRGQASQLQVAVIDGSSCDLPGVLPPCGRFQARASLAATSGRHRWK